MKKVLILLMFLIFIFGWVNTVPANPIDNNFTCQFEDYEWGTPMHKIEKQLKMKGKYWDKYKDDSIMYSDNIFNYACEVYLSFTSKDRLLALIAIEWNNTYVGSDLKRILTKKYGNPFQYNKYTENYSWNGMDYENIDNLTEALENPPMWNLVILDYNSFDTKLFYYGGEYYEQYLKEKEQMADKESNRF